MSKKYIFNSSVSYETNAEKIERENGVIKNIVIAKQGLNKNDTYFSERFLVELLEEGNKSKPGIKARFGHPNMCSTSLGSFVGVYKNFRLENGVLFGDLYLDPISEKVQVEGRGISMYHYILEMATNNSLFFGNSISILANDVEERVVEDNQEKIYVGHKLIKWISSDLVDDPAATDSLFYGVNDLGTKLTDFLDNNTEIFTVVENNPAIILDFLERYKNYTKRKNIKFLNMSVLDKVKKMLGKNYDLNLTLANGQTIVVITEAGTPSVGDKVTDAEGKNLPKGEYLLADEQTLVIDQEGIITEIKPKEEQTNDPTEEIKEFGAKLEEVTQMVEKKFNSLKDENTILAMALLEVSEKYETLAKSVKSQFEVFDKGKNNDNKGENLLDLARRRREEYK